MNGTLRRIEKELRNIAKRYKNIKYSKSLLLSFLVTGAFSYGNEENFSGKESDPAKQARLNLNNSIDEMKQVFREAKKENDKLIKKSSFELVQLMEQGDHVIKSPWASWQFGANYMYNNWNGVYKGRGDKVSEGAITNKSVNSLDPLAKNIAVPNLKSTSYGSTDLNIVEEPNASVSVTTRITPVIIDKTTTRKNQEPYVFRLPYFEAREIGTPSIPTVNAPNITVSGFADFPGRWINGVAGRYSYWHTNNGIGNTDGNLYQTSVEKGEVLKRRGGTVNRIQLKNYQRGQIQVRPVNVDAGVEPPENIDLAGDVPTFFMSLEDIPYSYFGKNSKLSLINENNNVDGQIFIHFETEGNTTDKFDKLKADGHISTEEFNEIRKYTDDTDFKNDQGGELYHVNRGTVELGGTGIRYVQTTFAGNMGRRVNLVENRGNIISMNYEEGNTKTHSNAIFLYGPDTGAGYTGTQHIYANNKTGKISMYGEKGYLAVFTASSTLARGDVSFINDGEANLYGRNSVGLFITKDARGKLSQKSNFIMNKPINLQGDNTTGLYIENSGDGIKNDRNTARFVIGAKDNATIPAYVPENSLLNAANSKVANHNKVGGDENLAEEIVGIYLNNPIAELHVKVPQLEIEKFAKKSIGIFSKDGEVKATDGNIELKGGEDNIALYANGGKIDYTGNITVNKSTLVGDKGNTNGTGNMAVFAASPNNYVKVNGNITMDTRDTVAIYSDNTKVDLNGKLDIKLKPESTGKNIAIYAKNSSATSPVTVQTNQSKIEIDGKKDDGTITNQGLALYAEQGGQIVANGTSLSDGLYMKVTNGGSAIVSDGATSNVQAKYSTIDYDGNGYALYTKNNGNIDVRNAKINLYGKSTGFERSGVLSDPFTINLANSKFYAHSNDVSIMSLKNIPSLNFSTLAGTFFSGYLGGAEVHGASGAKNYKIATIDGIGAFNIDSDYDKSRALDPANEGTNDYVLTRHLLMQRAKINLKSGNNVRAILSSSDIADLGEQTAVGLANYVGGEINLETNTSVNVDRTDKASGAVGVGSVGLFADSGRVNVASGATINVEKENNFVNGSSVGIYASNGTRVSNAGTVNVGGKGSIGILGMTRRIDADGNPLPSGSTSLELRNESTGVINMDGESAIGMYVLNNHSFSFNPINNGYNDGIINMSGNNAIGMLTTGAHTYNNNIININSDQGGIGIYATAGTAANRHTSMTGSGAGSVINLKSSVSKDNPNIGIYTEILEDGYGSVISNSGDIIGGDNTYGIYGEATYHDTGKIKLGNNSVGIFTTANATSYFTDVNVTDGEIEVGNNSKGIFVSGSAAANVINGAKMTIGDNSFAYVLDTKEIPADPVAGTPVIQSVLESNSTDETKLGNNSIFIYSSDKTALITNNTPLRTTGNKNYGIYASGEITNLADMDFSAGVGNVGILNVRDIGSTTSKAVNGQLGAASQPTITVGKSDVINENYSIGMAAGYLDKDGVLKQTGHVENYGKIDVVGEGGIGMYAAGSGSMAINHVGAEINLSGQDSIGMYLTDSAIGENYGTIRTAPNNTKDGIVGVVANNNAVIKNYGTIEIKGEGNTGILLANGGDNEGNDPVNLDGAEGVVRKRIEPTGKKINGVEIVAPGNGTATIKRNGKPVVPTLVDTIPAKPNEITAGATTLDLRNTVLAEAPSLTRASSLGMYVDTSGRQFTNPIQGLEHLTNLKNVNLIFGIEATNYTDSRDIKVGENILEPYNRVISTLSRNGKTKFNLNSGSLTWIATGTQDASGKFNAVYLSKIPYTSFAKDQDTYNFMDGLEQRYGVDGVNSREKALFDKLNAIGKGEPQLFAQAVDQMKGHQYSNVQQRVNATGRALDKEFDYLRNEWRNTTKNSNKIKAFGMRDEYNTDTAGVIDYTSNAYGVAYVHENETVKLGNSSGWYAGAVNNNFRFKDIGKSREEQTMLKAGIFKTMSPMTDHNGSLQWTIGGDVFAGINSMKRKFLVVDDIFEAKSTYSTYGVSLKNELGYDIRMSERTHLRPYGSLKMEYGRFSDIKEETGQMRLEVEGNDYFSVKPEVGLEFKYVQPLAVKTQLSVGLSAAYENELGRLQTGNRARVGYTSADWYNLEKEKEDRRGNGKFDLNIGIDNTRFGVTVNAGYDTKGHNVRGGIGFRAIY